MKVLAHYVYPYQGDKFIRKSADVNRNGLDEIAVFSEFSTNPTERHLFRVIEFSSAGIEKFGSAEIFTQTNRKQPLPRSDAGRRPALMIYIPPDVSAQKIFVKSGFGKKLVFYSQKFERNGDDWAKTGQLSRFKLLTDLTNYIEIVKAIFPKGSGDE